MNVNNGFVKVAEWSDETEFIPVAAKYMQSYARNDFEKNRTYVVTTILEDPYIMMRKLKQGEQFTGKEQYEGYCRDLADLLARKLGINCKFYSFFSLLIITIRLYVQGAMVYRIAIQSTTLI